jgi:signal peptidase I
VKDDFVMSAPSDTKPSDVTKQPIDWWAEVRGLGGMLLAVLAFHSFIAKPFYIPRPQCCRACGWAIIWWCRNIPMAGTGPRPASHPAARGLAHLAHARLWRYRDRGAARPSGDDYIKRVVARPGDRIALRHGQIILNGHPVPQAVEPPPKSRWTRSGAMKTLPLRRTGFYWPERTQTFGSGSLFDPGMA